MRSARSPVTGALTLSLLLALAGCGGGGGNDGAAAAPVTPAVPANQPPQLTSARFEVDEDQSLTAQLTATDAEGQSISFTRATDPAQGTLTLASSGALTYVPPANFNGNASFDVTLTDAGGAQRTATVTIAVRPVNDAPVARDDQCASRPARRSPSPCWRTTPTSTATRWTSRSSLRVAVAPCRSAPATWSR